MEASWSRELCSLALALGRETDSGRWFLGRERAAAKRVDAVLELVDLAGAGHLRVGSYSLGMRQRLGLAGALLGDPELLILDEPANGLDPEGVRWLRDFMRSFASEGKTVMVSSHVLAEVAQPVDQVIIVNKGKLITFEPARPADGEADGCRPRPRAGCSPAAGDTGGRGDSWHRRRPCGPARPRRRGRPVLGEIAETPGSPAVSVSTPSASADTSVVP